MNMSKKLISLIVLLTVSLFLTGCGEVIELTDTETKLIAEYAGELLLKYDRNFDDRLNEGEKIAKEMEEEAIENPDTAISTEGIETTDNTENVTEEATEETTEGREQDDQGDNTEKNNGQELNNFIDDTAASNDNVSDDNVAVGTESDIAKILGMDGISITYKDYLITDHYPATDADGQFIYLDASEGYQLLVLRFNISNIASEPMKFTMLDEDVDYRIVCNGKNAANPMLTILMNDLGTMEAVLSPEENQEGVLIFQISDSMQSKLQTMELKVQYNNAENVITIL